MNNKEKAYQLFKSGFSYGEIADELSISKSTAHNYVKEIKTLNKENISTPVQNSSGKGLNVRSEQKTNEQRANDFAETKKTKQNPIKEFTGDDLLKKEFISYEFTGKFLELVGKPSKPFSGIIWGLPKGGKSNLSIRFADYLSEYFGSVCYIAAEEGESVTLQMKIKDIGGSKVTFVELKDKQKIRAYLQSKNYVFVFIDSINNAEIDHEFLELIKRDNPKTSFIGIVQATKSGNFKGDQALTHNCDFIIKVIAGIAYHEGRFNERSEISIFDEPLYVKNPEKEVPEIKESEEEPNVHPEIVEDQITEEENPMALRKPDKQIIQADNKDIWRDVMKSFPDSPAIQRIAAKQLGLPYSEPIVQNPVSFPALTTKDVMWGAGTLALLAFISHLSKRGK